MLRLPVLLTPVDDVIDGDGNTWGDGDCREYCDECSDGITLLELLLPMVGTLPMAQDIFDLRLDNEEGLLHGAIIDAALPRAETSCCCGDGVTVDHISHFSWQTTSDSQCLPHAAALSFR